LAITQNKERPEKKHKFEYREKKYNETRDKFSKTEVKTMIKNELNLVTQLGCSRKDYHKFLESKIKIHIEAEDKKKIMTREKEKLEEVQRLVDSDKTLAKTALLHVNSLKNWEKNTLPKIGKPENKNSK
jgi:hypothetical protein